MVRSAALRRIGDEGNAAAEDADGSFAAIGCGLPSTAPCRVARCGGAHQVAGTMQEAVVLALHAGRGLRETGTAFAAGAYEIGTFHGAPRAGLDAGLTDDDATTTLRPIG